MSLGEFTEQVWKIAETAHHRDHQGGRDGNTNNETKPIVPASPVAGGH